MGEEEKGQNRKNIKELIENKVQQTRLLSRSKILENLIVVQFQNAHNYLPLCTMLLCNMTLEGGDSNDAHGTLKCW